MEKEIEILSKLNHPFISKYQHSYEDEKYIYIVMDLIEGQDLFKYMEEKGRINEREASIIIYKIIQALEHIHS
jgi:serine/threonine protein kinase